MVPAAKPEAAMRDTGSAQKKLTAAPNHSICQLRNHIPARAGVIRFISLGAIHVAESSNNTDSVRTRAMWKELYPAEIRYVTIWPAKLSTVRYSKASAKDGRNAWCW